MRNNPNEIFKPRIRPERLRIRENREVRVALECDRKSFASTVTKMGEVWCTNISSGATVHRRITSNNIPSIFWHHHDILEQNEEHPHLIYDWTQWKQSWAVQRSNEYGKKSFCLEIADNDGVAHQVRLTKKSNIAPFLELVNSKPVREIESNLNQKNRWGLLCFIQARRRDLLKRPDISRRVDRKALPAFFSKLAQCQHTQKVTLVNSVCKLTCKVKFNSSICDDKKVRLESPDVIFHLDNSSVEEAWMVQCSCGCGEEVLDMYDMDNRLIASIACMGITQEMAHLLPSLN